MRLVADGHRRRAQDSSRLDECAAGPESAWRDSGDLGSHPAWAVAHSGRGVVIIIGFLLILVGAPPVILLSLAASGLPGRCRGHRSSGSAAERDRAG